MADPTEGQLKAAARKALAAGDAAAAKRLVDAARKVAGAAGQSEAMKSGLAELSGMSRDPAAALDAEQERRASERSVGAMLYDNIIGDSTDSIDSTGEQIGRGARDIAKAGAAGLARGVTGLAGLPGTIGDLGSAGLTKAGQAIGIIPDNWVAPESSLSSAALTETMGNVTGGATDFKGNTTAGQYAGTIGEFLPAAAAFGGVNPANLLKYGVTPAVASETAGQATQGTSWEGPARVAGALIGGIGPDLISKGARALLSPNGGVDPERLKLAKVLDDFGVPISAGQRVGNEALRRKEGLTGAGQALNETQREAFTTAALKTAGIDAKRATPEVLDEAATRIGAVFDDVTRGVDVTPEPASLTALSEAVSTYKSLAPTGNQAPLVSDVFKAVSTAFRGGNPIPAATVNKWRSGLSKLTTSAEAATREAAIQALNTIDDMLTASLNAAGRAEDVARLATARGEWRNFLAIQKAATGAGEATAAGLLSPAQLRSAVVQQGRAAFARGQRGDLGDLARAGVGVMDSLPNSGTPAGIRAMIPGGSLSGALGAGIGSSFGPSGAAIGALGGLALPGVAGAIRMSRPMQAYLANQLAGPSGQSAITGLPSALIPFAGESRNALATRP